MAITAGTKFIAYEPNVDLGEKGSSLNNGRSQVYTIEEIVAETSELITVTDVLTPASIIGGGGVVDSAITVPQGFIAIPSEVSIYVPFNTVAFDTGRLRAATLRMKTSGISFAINIETITAEEDSYQFLIADLSSTFAKADVEVGPFPLFDISFSGGDLGEAPTLGDSNIEVTVTYKLLAV